MDNTMRAAVVREFGQPLVIEEVDVPRPKQGEVLMKVAASGVCHTDLHAAHGDWPVKPSPPFIPGHEGVGHVVAVGAGVSHVKEGDRIGVPSVAAARLGGRLGASRVAVVPQRSPWPGNGLFNLLAHRV